MIQYLQNMITVRETQVPGGKAQNQNRPGNGNVGGSDSFFNAVEPPGHAQNNNIGLLSTTSNVSNSLPQQQQQGSQGQFNARGMFASTPVDIRQDLNPPPFAGGGGKGIGMAGPPGAPGQPWM